MYDSFLKYSFLQYTYEIMYPLLFIQSKWNYNYSILTKLNALPKINVELHRFKSITAFKMNENPSKLFIDYKLFCRNGFANKLLYYKKNANICLTSKRQARKIH